MSANQVLRDISINGYKYPIPKTFEYIYPQIKLFEYIYLNSIIGQEEYYEISTLISYKTSNNQEIINRMPFYVFNNFQVFLTKLMEKEANGNGEGNNTQETMQNTMGQTMGQTKSMFKQSMPKMPRK